MFAGTHRPGAVVSSSEIGGPDILKAVREFGGSIAVNMPYVPNYGPRYRHGEPLSTAMAESAVHQIISKRFVKKQQMKWTKRGAHLLLQGRAHV